jgi:hypothetical protein
MGPHVLQRHRGNINYTYITSAQNEYNHIRKAVTILSPLSQSERNDEDDTNPEPGDEGEQHEHIPVVIIRTKTEQLPERCHQRAVIVRRRYSGLTRFMIRLAETLTGTP